MQLTFPNGESANVPLEQGEVTVGSRSGNRVCLPNAGLAGHHASFVTDRRGLWLRVPAGATGVHVNARPVRHLSLLRAGDLVCLDKLRIQLRADDQPAIDGRIPVTTAPAMTDVQRLAASRVVLRALSGPQFGRALPLTEARLIGRAANADIRLDDPSSAERHASVELHGDRIVLRAIAADTVSLVNGIPVRDALLAPGDQVTVDQHRFLLEAPGMPPRGVDPVAKPAAVTHTQTIKAVRPVDTSPPAPPVAPAGAGKDPGSLWWLIAAATVLAAALTALLVYAPRLG